MIKTNLRNLSYVPRWAIIRTIRQQSVAEHSFYVALIAKDIAEYINWGGNHERLVYLALTHDLEEIITGDTPSPMKRVPEEFGTNGNVDLTSKVEAMTGVRIHKASGEAKLIIKIADILEAISFLQEEAIMGNMCVKILIEHLIMKARQVARPSIVFDQPMLRSYIDNFVIEGSVTPEIIKW